MSERLTDHADDGMALFRKQQGLERLTDAELSERDVDDELAIGDDEPRRRREP